MGVKSSIVRASSPLPTSAMSEETLRERKSTKMTENNDTALTSQESSSLDDCSGFSSTLGTKDKFSMGILLVLYTLQGIPMGLSGSIPLILKERGPPLLSLPSFPFVFSLTRVIITTQFYRC